MLINPWLSGAILALSLTNTILLFWLGLTVLLNTDRRSLGLYLAGGALLLGGLFFLSHSAIVSLGSALRLQELELWWRAGWIPVTCLPFAWYSVMLWYGGYWEPQSPLRPRHRPYAPRPHGVHQQHDGRCAVCECRGHRERRVTDGLRVDGHPVGSRQKRGAYVLHRPDAASDDDRHEHVGARPPDDGRQGVAAHERCVGVDVQQLVGTVGVVGARQVVRIADRPLPLHGDTLDDARALHIQARHDARHHGISSMSVSSRVDVHHTHNARRNLIAWPSAACSIRGLPEAPRVT